MRKLLLLLFVSNLLMMNSFAKDQAQGYGIVKGTVTTSDGKAAADVSVQIKGSSRGTITDESGKFELRRLSPGDYTLQVFLLDFESIEQSVHVSEGQVSDVSFQLKISEKELNTVIVTGSRKYRVRNVSPSLRLTTPILELPQNIQVVTKELIADQQVFDMMEGIQRNVSGAQRWEHLESYAKIYMRGSQLTAFRNGMNVQMQFGPLAEDMSMVERIEFVKGPAGFMMANGEPGGFYNVVTKKPTGLNKGEVSLSLGSFDLYRAAADIDGKLSKDGKLLYRLNLMGQLRGAHRDYEYNNRYSFVPVIKYLVDDKTSLTLEYSHQYSEMNILGSSNAYSERKYADLPVNFTAAEPNLDPTKIYDRSVLAIFEHNINDRWKFTAQAAYFNYDLRGQQLWTWGTALKNDSLMHRGINVWDALGMNKTGQMFVNGEVKTGKLAHKLLAGLDMGHKEYYADWDQYAPLGDTLFNLYKPVYGKIARADIPVWDRSKDIRERGVRYSNNYSALYIQDELSFFENKVRLTLAGRYTTSRDVQAYRSRDADHSKFTPRFGLSYSITKNTSAYAVFDQVFLPTFGADWQGKSFKPITGSNIELGMKRDWMEGKWNTALSVYQITKNNMLTADTEHRNFSRQTGQMQVKGVEVDIKGQLTRNLDVVINYAYADAKYTKDSKPEVVGNQVPGTSKHIHNSWISYKLSNGKLNGLRFSLGYQYLAGRAAWFIYDKSDSPLPEYFRLDGGIAYASGKLGFNLNVNNILGRYLLSGAPYASEEPFTKLDRFYWQAEPKINSRITVSYKF